MTDQALTPEESRLLDTHGRFYLELASGEREPTTTAQHHFLAVISGRAVANTDHERAFFKSRRLAVQVERAEARERQQQQFPNLCDEEPGQRRYPSAVADKFDIEYMHERPWD